MVLGDESTNLSESYDASNALYRVTSDLIYPLEAEMYGGLRALKEPPDTGRLWWNGAKVKVEYFLDLFPSVNMTFDLTEKTLPALPMANINKPEFREIAPSSIIFRGKATYYGIPGWSMPI